MQYGIYHCTFLQQTSRPEVIFDALQVPEMSRVALAELVLQINLLGLGEASDFLKKVIQPPPERSVQAATSQLLTAGAITPTGDLTPLGTQLCPPQKVPSLQDVSSLTYN